MHGACMVHASECCQGLRVQVHSLLPHHGLLLVQGRAGVGLAHKDADVAARVARTTGPPLDAVDAIAIALTLDGSLMRAGWGQQRGGGETLIQ